MWDPKLSPAEIERLDLLVEECSEVIQIAQKIKRFGFDSTNRGSHPPNRSLLEGELGDLTCIMHLMITAGELDGININDAIYHKAKRVGNFTRFQQEVLKEYLGESE